MVMEVRGIHPSFDPQQTSQPPKCHDILMSLIGGVMWVAVVHNKTEFEIWRQCLLYEDDRRVFDELVSGMWPDRYQRPNFATSNGQVEAYLDFSSWMSATESKYWWLCSSKESEAQVSMYHTAANILDDVRSHDEFNFKGFLNMDYFHETNQDDGSHQAPLRPAHQRQVQQSPKCPIPQLNLRMIRPPRKNPIRKKA
jgi:hypothetical protein